ncbi:MAG TPA: hypothetical protein VGM63_05850, partial [Mucilaginibacter sp.]
NILKETHFGDKILFYKIDYLYGSNEIIGKKFDSDGDFVGGFTLKYDKYGNETEIVREGSIFGPPRQVFKNDTNGHSMEIDNYIDDNTLGSKTLIEYNKDGLKSAQGSYKINGQINSSESYTYDTLKNLKKYERYYANGYLDENQVFNYNDWDQSGNWHVKTVVVSHEEGSNHQFESDYIIIKRRIQYY